jgi:predicted lipid-binding transport protein (Tim44 family)
MKTMLSVLVFALTLGLSALDAEAAKRFGGGGNLGAQRSTPAMKEAPKQAPAATPAQPAQAAPATPATPQPQPSFMSRWGGMLAGLGIGALLGSMFGGGALGSGIGMLLMILAVAGIGYMLFRAFASRGATGANRMQYAGDGAPPPAPRSFSFGGTNPQLAEPVPQAAPADLPPGFKVEPFLRQAKIAFIRLQAANDAKDLDDIRDYTTPEMYAELAMQLEERGDAPQKTEVVSFDASLVEAVVEGNYEIASVRYSGSIRESSDALAEPFDEVWHVKKKANDPKAPWLIAGIQQLPSAA